MYKKFSKSKIILAIISLIITFFVWQQGLKDSLQRPSANFDISQKEIEITELAIPSIPKDFKNIIANDPQKDMSNFLSQMPFDQLTERNKFIWILLNQKDFLKKTQSQDLFNEKIYKDAFIRIKENNIDPTYALLQSSFDDFKSDRYLYHLVNNKFDFEDINEVNQNVSKVMFIKLIIIKLFPLLTIFIGSGLILKYAYVTFKLKKIEWKEFTPLDLNSLDMILLIAGGFVVLGEVVSPLFSITIVDLIFRGVSKEILQSLKIFFGYFFMAIPPLLILYSQIKSIDEEFNFKNDYFQFKWMPIKDFISKGFTGWLMIIPFVLLTSLVMNYFIDNQAGSNPLLEIVLNNNNYFAFFLLFITTTLLAPIFEELVFRGVLLPILSRDFGKIFGIITSSFIFALAHLSFNEFPPLFVLGIGLAMTRLISGRLSSSIFMHSLWNGLTFLNLFLLRT